MGMGHGWCLLLVHSPLIGCDTWDLVSAELTGQGWLCTGCPGPDWHRQRRTALLRAPGPGDRSQRRGAAGDLGRSQRRGAAAGRGAGVDRRGVRGYVFIDAGLPAPGQAWMATVPPDLAIKIRETADAEGCRPSRCGGARRPWPSFSRIRPSGGFSLRAALACPWQCSRRSTRRHHCGPVPRLLTLQMTEAYEPEAAKARELGWPVAQVLSHHLAMLTESGRVAGTMYDLIGSLPR
jgi:hypothetical protein